MFAHVPRCGLLSRDHAGILPPAEVHRSLSRPGYEAVGT